jgi:hypothetical protein
VSDRWIPVLAAAVGVLGGVGGALIGGYWANEGQEERLLAEQQAATRNVRRETYATYLQAAESLVQKSAVLNETGGLDTEAEQRAFIQAEGIPVLTARAAVDLVAEKEVRDAAHAMTDALEKGIEKEKEWTDLRQDFIDEGKKEIFPGE